VLQAAQYKYGRDYFLGDLVSIITPDAATLSRKIYAVSIGMTPDGAEEVNVDLAAI
jgi:hypothetical protein